MGWLFCAATQLDLIQLLISDEQNEERKLETLLHQVNTKRNVLWTVTRCTKFGSPETVQTFISCILMEQDADNSGYQRWGFKRIDEFFHPAQYDCPLKFLSVATDGINEEWREQVRIWHSTHRIPKKVSMCVPPIVRMKTLGHKVVFSAETRLLRED